MFSRSALRVALEVPHLPTRSTTIFPQRACLHQTTARTNAAAQSHSKPASSSLSSSSPIIPSIPQQKQQQQQQQRQPKTSTPKPKTKKTKAQAQAQAQARAEAEALKLPVQPTFSEPLRITKSLQSMLPYLTTQQPHYITAHLHARAYLLTEGDHLRLPFLMPKVQPGNVLRFNRASVLGSRDFTLKGTPYVDERLFECRVRVLGVDADKMSIKEKTKRRQRHVKFVRSKHKHTLMRVMSVRVKSMEELLQEGAVVVEDEGEGGAAERVEVR